MGLLCCSHQPITERLRFRVTIIEACHNLKRAIIVNRAHRCSVLPLHSEAIGLLAEC